MTRMQGMKAQHINHFKPGSTQMQCPVCEFPNQSLVLLRNEPG